MATSGTTGDDIIVGTDGGDTINTKAGDDTIYGGDGNDQILAGSGDDELNGGSGNDFLNGGLGTDTAIYSGSIKDYVFGRDGENFYVSGPDGNDHLVQIERLQFDDALITLGQNNAPIAFDDVAATNEDAGTLTSSGSVLDNDYDFEGDVLKAIAGSFTGTYGTLTLNQDGTYTYTLFASAQALALGEVVQDVFTYTVTDGSLTDTGTLTITVTGANDGPVAHADTATTSENASVDVNVLANDTDVDHGAVLTVTAASAPAGQGSASVVGNQVRFNPGSDFDYLAVGESAVVTVSYSITDEHGATSSSTVQVTVTGTNDAPTIDAAGTTATGSVTELPNGDPGEGIAVHEADGTIAFDDLDLSDTHSASATAQGSGYYGTFTLDPVNQSGDSVGWHFDVNDAEIDGLEEGEVVTQTYTVTIDDGHGGTTSQDVTITITGAADSVPPDGTNWYIDNSAVGSANTGSPTDPFTSIAAFNAAQGTAGGPGVNDNVFLLAGTGTGLYAEADGINLLDGQVLTGVATGSVRPTITATAGDGIDVAENNTISGIDIGSTSGAGIDDDGGTVGTLTVSDVAKSGSGQVVDIDNGGTLNVTLNSASSTGSTGGAIDLNLVGGSFTIAGATTITGVHSGGGIDVTGSSATVTLAGGGLVSTGANTAISFTGNAGGTLAITGGGFDIATTSGSGLVGSGGGTIIITGAGNNVATGSGGAIFVDGTAIGAAGLTLESVSANPGTATGIYLRNTGTAGGLEVTGTGVAGSGGTIDGRTGADLSTTTGIGVYLENTSHVSLTGMLLQNFTNFAIRGVNVNNFSLVDSIVTNTAGFNGTNAASEGSISFTGLTGDAVFDGVLVERGLRDNLGITNSTGHLDLSVIDSSFLNTSTASGQNGIGITLSGTASLNALITGSTFSGNRINNLLVNNNGSGNARVQIGLDGEAGSGGTWSNSGTGINLNHNGTGSFNFDILNATISNAAGQSSPVNINMLTGARGPLTGNIVDNLITNHAASTGPAVRVISNGTDSVVPIENTLTVLIEGNTIINNAANIGISVIARNGNSTLNATIHDNVITNTSTSGLAHGIEARAGAASADLVQLNLDISDNVIAIDPAAALAGAFGIRLFRITATTNAVARLEDYTGGTTDTAAIHAFLSGENNGSSVLATVNTVNGAGWGFIDDVPMPPAPLYDVPLIP